MSGPIGPSSHGSDNKDHKNLVGLNESSAGPSKTPSTEALPPEIDAIHFTKKDLQQIIQSNL